MLTSRLIRSFGQMYMQAGWARARQPSHLSTWTKVGTDSPLGSRQRRDTQNRVAVLQVLLRHERRAVAVVAAGLQHRVEHFGAELLLVGLLALGDEAADPRPADRVLLILVATEPLVARPAARAVEPLESQHRFDADVGDLLEDAMGGVGVVVLPHAGMVPTEHVVCAPEVLADEGVEDRLPGPGVAHV